MVGRWRHGTITGYFNHGCRCSSCHGAASAYTRDRRAAQKKAETMSGDDPAWSERLREAASTVSGLRRELAAAPVRELAAHHARLLEDLRDAEAAQRLIRRALEVQDG